MKLRRRPKRGRRVRVTMVCLRRLYSAVEWLWRRFFLHYFRAGLRLITLKARLAIGWFYGGRKDAEVDGDKNPEEVLVDGEESESGGQRGQRSADLTPEPEDEDAFDGDEYRVETTDEFYCEYDTTWEADEDQDGSPRSPRRPTATSSVKFSRFTNAARDMYNYRHDYPMWRQRWNQPDHMPNLSFYLGQTPSVPDDAWISDFHDHWKGDYERLERVHTFIQWLFPLQEPGMNAEAPPLTKEEVKEFRENNTAKENLLESYKLMLDFYGIELSDEETGAVTRASNWRDRFNNLNRRTHNNLRITRILKCLGTLGYPHYQAPLVQFFLEQTLVHGELPNVKESALHYFVFAVLDKRRRRSLIKFAYLNYDRKQEFVWCPRKIQRMWSRLAVSQPQRGMSGEFESGSEDEAKDPENEAAIF